MSTRGGRRPGRPARPDAPADQPVAAADMQVVETPDVAVEEVVLNRRGTPARERKKNRFYYDDDMITSDTQLRQTKQKNRSPHRKIKDEPVEQVQAYEEVLEQQVQEEISDYQFGDILANEEVGLEQDIEIESTAAVSPERRKKDRLLMPPPASPRSGGQSRQSSSRQQPAYMRQPTAKQVAQAVSSIISKPRSNRQSMEDEFGSYDNLMIKHDPDSPSKRTSKTLQLQQILPKPTKGKAKDKRTKSNSPDRSRVGQRQRYSNEFDQAPFPSFEEEVSNEVEVNQFGAPYEVEIEFKKSKPPKEQRRTKYNKDKDPLRALKRRSSSGAQNSAIELGSGKFMSASGLTVGTGLDKKTAHNISIRLRNLLKLPKAHKWVCYEWFYSNIDKVLFDGENDFQICLKESFPDLKQTQMSHEEWTTIRRMMGKPRRCSQAFFDEEREELQRRRHKIRMIQQRKITDFNYKELPDEIPLQLVIGTKVTGRLRKPQDGLFTGTIEAVDTSNNTYRITFDRPGLGTHSIPDYEVLSNDPVETVSTSSFALKIPRRSYGGVAGAQFKISSALQDEMSGFPKSPFPADGMLGGFPIRLLDMIVRLSKLLKAKREKILLLKELNVEAEKVTSYGRELNEDYRIRYSRCVLDLDSMNKEMSLYLEAIQQYCLDIAPDHGANQMIVPELVQEQCRQEALLIVDTYNTKQNRQVVTSPRILTLIANLTSLALQAKALSNGERNLYEVKSIKDTLKEIKASLDGKNVQLFQDKVELPMNRIQAGLTMTYR